MQPVDQLPPPPVFGRSGAWASRHAVAVSALTGIGMAVAFTAIGAPDRHGRPLWETVASAVLMALTFGFSVYL